MNEASLRRRFYLAVVHRGIRVIMRCYGFSVALATLIGRHTRKPGSSGYVILLTGTFYSDNWLSAHLKPLARSRHCARLCVVSDTPIPPMEKIEAIYPSKWLTRLTGRVPARLLTFLWVGLRERPHIVGGFHLMFNGMIAVLLGKMIGARSLYFCVGGPQELIGGGYATENRLFARLKTPDEHIERQLLNTVGKFDLVVTMGRNAINYFEKCGVKTTYCTVSGGIDGSRFYPPLVPPNIGVVLVARLTPVKRVDRYLEAISLAKKSLPNITAAIIGDGPLFDTLKEQAKQLGIEENVRFAGHQDQVENWLRQAKLFVLTSETEGLALSMMEAMMCGVPAVVPDVGDLCELVENGVNGYLIKSPTPELFAERIVEVLADENRWKELSRAAVLSASRYELKATTRHWDDLLSRFQ